ncbi:MAG: hypothetical protein KAI83_08835 [Thiomargarita sp.]|nr:hypothetical protein [Thiomargarita sp.]
MPTLHGFGDFWRSTFWRKMMKKYGQYILFCLLSFGCAKKAHLAVVNDFSETWVQNLSVKATDVKQYYQQGIVNTLEICLHRQNTNSQQCDGTAFLKTSQFNGFLILDAKKICEFRDGAYNITSKQSKNVDYVVKCGNHPIKKPVIASWKKLCSSQESKLENDRQKFCLGSTGSQVKQLEDELVLKKAKLETCQALAKKNELSDQLIQEQEKTREFKRKNDQLTQKLVQAEAKIKSFEQAKKCEMRSIGDNRITVIIKNYTLRFVKVKSTYRMGMKKGIRITLTEQEANAFHQEAMKSLPKNYQPIYPNIFKAVSKNERLKHVAQFWVQEKTINPQLYKDIIVGGSADSISYDDAMNVIDTLNSWCQGEAQFQLPDEKQFVSLARMAYNPIEEGLQPCETLKEKVALNHIKQLFGYKWQLTNSYCSSLDNVVCDNKQSRIKKGGSSESRYAAECMPEYRAESMPDLREQNTTFRLIFKRLK